MNSRRAVEKVLMRLGVNLFSWNKADRRLLERTILPAIAKMANCKRVLFVGCEYYTRPYARLFRHLEFWTIDVDAKRARYGSRNHVVGTVERLEQHFAEGYFDVIICNGVFGWGLNTREAAEAAFGACYRCLSERGLFVLGWDDFPRWRPFPPSECESLTRFEPHRFGPLGTEEHRTDTPYRHVFSFFQKPSGHYEHSPTNR